MAFRKREGTGNCKWKHWIAPGGERASEEEMDFYVRHTRE